MLSYRLGTVNDFHWGFKPVLSYSKPHFFSTSLGEEKERKNAFNLSNQKTKNLNSKNVLSYCHIQYILWQRLRGLVSEMPSHNISDEPHCYV